MDGPFVTNFTEFSFTGQGQKCKNKFRKNFFPTGTVYEKTKLIVRICASSYIFIIHLNWSAVVPLLQVVWDDGGGGGGGSKKVIPILLTPLPFLRIYMKVFIKVNKLI